MTPITEDQVVSLMKGLEQRERSARRGFASDHDERSGAFRGFIRGPVSRTIVPFEAKPRRVVRSILSYPVERLASLG